MATRSYGKNFTQNTLRVPSELGDVCSKGCFISRLVHHSPQSFAMLCNAICFYDYLYINFVQVLESPINMYIFINCFMHSI